ncbi:glycosyltransferase family 2 protein [Neokomagataea anthophila]|uniref:Glycosyltransferase family 2 protein n=1 Tax=Neokomagataea anthophila TaxID=2826925 RepID=A0ABS5E565_9PROT|nr:glycosyltransferase family 2 protein [Neokomagataea anthophila]MBR0559011.1 glycosyltransferase family 2 protein [Neokomagataea anthophila]
MLRTAAILFVRNDLETLGWWLAHHAALGFSTLIVCDDHSTDGTAALLESAAAFHDIRVYTSDSSVTSPSERRQKFKRTVIQDAEGEFDWLLFLAVDEFLYLEQAATLEEFLTEHPTPPALHWCIFGSNGHHTGAPFAPIERFTRHAPLDFPDHRITRRFIEPDTKAALPDPLSSTRALPNWDHGRILHFACGDQEHFQKRMGSTTALTEDHTQAWEHFNQNAEEWNGAQKSLPRTRVVHAAIDQARLAELHCRLTQAIINDPAELAERLNITLPQETAIPASAQHFAIGKTARLILNTATNTLQGVPTELLERDRHIPLILSVEKPSPDTGIAPALLTTERPNNRAFLSIEGVASLLAHIPLSIDTRERKIISPVTNTPVVFPLAEQSLTKVHPPAEYTQRLTAYHELTAHGHTLSALLYGLTHQDIVDASALGCAIALLPPQEAARLSEAFPGLIPASVMPAH